MDTKSEVVKVLMSPGEKRALKNAADLMNIGMSEYIRQRIPKPVIIEIEDCEFYKNGYCFKDSSIGICKYIECNLKEGALVSVDDTNYEGYQIPCCPHFHDGCCDLVHEHCEFQPNCEGRIFLRRFIKDMLNEDITKIDKWVNLEEIEKDAPQ